MSEDGVVVFAPQQQSGEAGSSNGANGDDTVTGNSNNSSNNNNNNNKAPPPPPHGFKMQIQNQQQQQQHLRTHPRKRKRDIGPVNMSLSSSSSSSSDEDDDNKQQQQLQLAVTIAPPPMSMDKQQQQQSKGGTEEEQESAFKAPQQQQQQPPPQQQQPPTQQQQQQQQQQPPTQQQPEGWRVKLYRLNADGSWDDCGTGRILCLYKQPKNETPTTSSSASPANLLQGDAWIYQELGEPTLCMHSEANNSNSNNNNGGGAAATTSPPPSSRILLRTRILLRDAYQRQGDNIITWCEPYLEEGNPTQGVDLALSFQDNGGCLDIWRQITQVQSRAADLFRRASSGSSSGSGAANTTNNNGPVNANTTTTVSVPPIADDNNNNDTENQTVNAAATAAAAPASGNSVADVAHAVAAAHHANLQRQQQQEMWVNVASEAAAQHHLEAQQQVQVQSHHEQHFEDAVGGMVAAYHESNQQQPQSSPQLPNPPTLANLEEIADTIAAVQHIQQRESLAIYISQNECSYLKSLLSLFTSAEARGDYGSLATLAACVKTILLLNDPSIIEIIVSDELIFEEVCSTLEYDPDLRDKANHRWFLRERAKFRTVALMEDEELVAAIHRAFRVNYLRDTLLRPTMDEGSLSTLSSLQTFTHADVVKGVTMSPAGTDDKGELLKDSYLAKVLRMLGRELHALCKMEWEELENLPAGTNIDTWLAQRQEEPPADPSTIVASGKNYPQPQEMSTTTWKQHLAPQDGSVASRRLRRRGCLSFLKELFNMVRISLQQNDKDDFFAVLVSMEVDLGDTDDEEKRQHNECESSRETESGIDTESLASDNKTAETQSTSLSTGPLRPVNLLSLLGTVLADPNTDVTEKGSVLEIIAGIAMHDPSLIRRRCLDFYAAWRRERKAGDSEMTGPGRPNPNEKKQIIFQCPPHDLLASLLFLLAVETDAGVLLQVSEIMRIILDTDMMGEHGPMAAGFSDEAEGLPPGGAHSPPHELHNMPSGSGITTTDQNQFLSMFYDHYVQWLAAPFQYTILHPVRRVPNSILLGRSESSLMQTMLVSFEKGECQDIPMLRMVPGCAIRSSFDVELISFCVRAHLYRMKCYLLRSRVLGSVLKVLKPTAVARNMSGDRCLKLSALRFLRAILSVNDEFYHRHIIQHNLFAPVFEAFRTNPVGDNLVSSAIVEMCDFIHTENIVSLIEHIVTKHLSATNAEAPVPSLEDVSSPYVSTLTVLRKAYEKNLKGGNKSQSADAQEQPQGGSDDAHSRYFHGNSVARTSRVVMNEKALEDQRKFREVDEEESYFESDDDEGSSPNTVVPPAVDEVAAQEVESELHRTPRMFSLAQAPLLNNGQLRVGENDSSDGHGDAMVLENSDRTNQATDALTQQE